MSTDRGIDKEDVVYIYIYAMAYYSAIKKNEVCHVLNRFRDYQTKWSKSERERKISCDITYMGDLKNDAKELISKTEKYSQT